MLDLHDTDSRILRITQLSPQAMKKMDSESYRTGLETDEVTGRAVLDDLQIALIDDMQQIGIEFFCSPGELFESYYLLDRLLDVFELLMPSTLYKRLSDEPKLRGVLLNILDGTVQEGDSTALSWVKYLGFDNDRLAEEYEEAVEHLMDKIHSTPVFDLYLRNLLALDPTALPEVEPEQRDSFHAYVERLSHRLEALMDSLFTAMPGLTAEKTVRRRIKIYLSEITRADRLDLYVWLFMPETEQPSLVEQQLRMEKWREFAAGSRLHPEYYSARGEALDGAGAIGMLLRLAAGAKTRESFRQTATDLAATLSHSNVVVGQEESATMMQTTRALAELLPKSEE